MGEDAGFTNNQQKIPLAFYVNFLPPAMNLTRAFYNIARVPKFWVRRVLSRNYGDRTVTMKQYPRLGRLITSLGVVKKILHGIARKDISAVPRPLDVLAGRWFIARRGQKRGAARAAPEFKHCLPPAAPRPPRLA